MTEEQRQAMIDALTAMIPDPPLPRYYRQDEEGYLTAVGIGGTDGKEISAGEYEAIRAVIAGKPTPPAGYDYRLRDDLHWQLSALPEPEEETLDPAQALELICGSSKLTRTDAAAFHASLVKSGTIAERPDSPVREIG